MSDYSIDIPANYDAPSGYTLGAHVSGPGWCGYHLIRESDNASCVARVRPDLDEYADAPDATAIDEVLGVVDVTLCACEHCGHPVAAEGVTLRDGDDYDMTGAERERCSESACSSRAVATYDGPDLVIA